MIPDFIYFKIRTETAPNGDEQTVERHVFFTEEAVSADMKLARESYPDDLAPVQYYKAKVMKTPLEKES